MSTDQATRSYARAALSLNDGQRPDERVVSDPDSLAFPAIDQAAEAHLASGADGQPVLAEAIEANVVIDPCVRADPDQPLVVDSDARADR